MAEKEGSKTTTSTTTPQPTQTSPKPIPTGQAAPGFRLVTKGEKGIGVEPGIAVDNSSE